MFSLQMFIIRWIYAFSDYLSEVIDDILHNNWFVDMFFLSFGGMVCWLFHWHIFGGLQAWDDASSISYLLCSVHLVWNCGHPGLQVRKTNIAVVLNLWVFLYGYFSLHLVWGENKLTFFCVCSDSSEDNQTKAKAKDGTRAENGSPRAGSAPRQECRIYFHMEQEQDWSSHVKLVTF